MTGPIRQSDAQFFYPQARHETGGPAPSETVGSVLSYSETFGSITSRIDFVPRDKEALERYGPIIEFAAAPGEAGLRATAALQKALKEGRSIEIREGIDVTFRRMPPAYDDLVGNPIAGPTITIGPAQGVPARRQIPDWDAELRVCSPTDRIGHAFRLVLQELEKVPAGWDDAISGTRGGLTVTALFRHDESNGAIRWEFTHVLDESPIAEQLLAVEFLNAVQASNEFVVLDRGTTGRPDFRVRRTAQAITPESRALTALLSDLSVLEQFADTRFALPAAIDPEDVRDIARTASLVRNKGSEATWSSARLTIPAGSLRRLSAGGVMVVDATASVTIFGKTIELGRIRRTLSSYRVASVEPSSDEAGQLNVQIKPLDAASDRIFETLEPQSRVRRPPPLPPKKAARSRGAKKRRRSR
jgi:hypothetical protein